MKKGQGAVEYIIILGVVILIALIVVSNISGFNIFKLSQTSQIKTNEITNLLGDISLKYSINQNGYVQSSVKSNVYANAQNVTFYINGCKIYFGDIDNKWKLNSTSCSISGNVGEEYEYNCSISFTDPSGLFHNEHGVCKGIFEEGQNTYQIITSTHVDFDEGTYDNTTWGSVKLINGHSIGTYTSRIFDAGAVVNWKSISWAEDLPYGEELSPSANNKLLLHLNEASGLIYDSSGNNNNGVVYGAAYGANGKFSTALSFDGINDYVDISNSESLNITGNQLTLEAWVKWNINPSSGNQWANIIDKNGDNEWQIQHSQTNSHFEFAVRTTSNRRYIQSTTTPQQNRWYYVAGVYNGTHISIYVNGIKERSFTLNGDISTSSSNISLGRRGINNDRYFNGVIDEVAVYSRALSDEEIMNHYKRGALRLNVSVRGCDDSLCSGESWQSPYEEPATYNINSHYFQYMFNFFTENTSMSPILRNVTLTYEK